MKTRWIALATLAIAAGSAAAQAPKSVDRAVAAWAKVKSMNGTFEQTITNPLMRSTSVATGTFAQQRPNKLSVRFSSGDAIVSDGVSLWVYLKESAPGQVMKRPMTDEMAIPVDAGQFLDSPAAKFDIVAKGQDTVNGRAAQAMLLTPKKGASAPFTKATVWIDDADAMIRQFEVTEQSGLIRRIRLTKMNVNPELTASDFRFVVPKGVKVIER